jgi:glycosyltransferase involved in cell wall biosynthesis
MESDRISIIIPTLNEEKLIRQSLNQFDEKIKKDFNLEIIVSDGGSRDRTIELINGCVDKLLIHKENFKQNISRGRNQGAKDSLGDVLIFLNADTLIPDKKIFFNNVRNVLNDDSVAAIACPVRVFPDEEKFSDKIFHFCYNNYVRLLNKFFMGMGRGECHIVKKNYYVKHKGYNEKLVAGEDFDFYKRIRSEGRIKYVKDCLVYESPRRYRKFGYPRVFWEWLVNSLSILLFKKSISKDWQEVR